MSESNASLAQRFRENDPMAFAALFGRYYGMVFARCMRMLGNHEDAEDATQETFSRVAKYIDRWDSGKPLEPWLIAIAGNRCRTHLSKRRRTQPLSDANEPATAETIQVHEADTLREEVALAITQLSNKQQAAFRLFHESGLKYEQIADQLDCPVGTAKTWVHRARANLMRKLRDRDVIAVRKAEVE